MEQRSISSEVLKQCQMVPAARACGSGRLFGRFFLNNLSASEGKKAAAAVELNNIHCLHGGQDMILAAKGTRVETHTWDLQKS